MNRYSNTERTGVHRSAEIVERELNWIFREITVADIGVDAVIELLEENNPRGKFLAVQIKTGKSNFHISTDFLTYYISLIHYLYWIDQLELPIIIIAHLPDTNETYWEIINNKTVEKTPTQYKIRIPKSNKFNLRAKKSLERHFELVKTTPIFTQEIIKQESLWDLIEQMTYTSEANESITKQTEFITDFVVKTKQIRNKLDECVSQGLNANSPRVKTLTKKYQVILTTFAKRIDSELVLWASYIGIGLNAFVKSNIILNSIPKSKEETDSAKKALISIPPAIDDAIENLTRMSSALESLKKSMPKLKAQIKLVRYVLDKMIGEFKFTKSYIFELLEDDIYTDGKQ